MLDSVDIETAPSPTHAIVWLHGLGADGHDFEPLVPMLVSPDWPALRFVFPHAPVRPVTVNGGMRMRAWYDILGLDIASRQDQVGIRAAIAIVGDFIAREQARGIPAHRIILAGFSQGGAIALATALRHAERLAGLIALSTYLPLADRSDEERAAANAALPVFLGHGTADPIVPHALGVATRDWLRARGHPVDWHSYPIGHGLGDTEVDDLRRWMDVRLRDE